MTTHKSKFIWEEGDVIILTKEEYEKAKKEEKETVEKEEERNTPGNNKGVQ